MKSLAETIRKPFAPLVESLRGYDAACARADLQAGLTVAVIAVPQSMAYAIIAGVAPVYGLYTMIFQCVIASLFNSQRLLSVGPTNTQSLLVASTITYVIRRYPGYEGLTPEDYNALYLQLVIGLTLIKGVMQLGFVAAGLGAMVRYVSTSVIVGFTAGAGVLIAVGQISSFLGFTTDRAARTMPGVIGTVQSLWPNINEVKPWAVGIGLSALVFLIASQKISKMFPGPLIAIVAAGLAVFFLGPDRLDITLIGEIPSGLPTPAIPTEGILHIDLLLPGALALSLLGLLEAYSIGRSIAAKTGDRTSANQELFSQGMTNLLSSFMSCIPGSASFSRSALNFYAGAKTGVSSIVAAVCVALIFLLLSPYAKYIPMTALAAILFVVAYGLIDWRYMKRIVRGDRADATVCFATFAATLFLPLAYAVFVGILLNLALYLRTASRLHLQEMVRSPGGPFIEQPLSARSGEKNVLFLQIEGDLFFGVADELEEKLAQVAHSPVRVVIFRLKRTHSVDSTVLGVLDRFTHDMHSRNKHVLLCGIKSELLDVFKRFGLVSVIGEDNVFETSYGVFTSATQALARARELIGESIDDEHIDLSLIHI